MLPFHMIDAQHPRRTSDSFSGPAPILRPQFGPACPDPVVGLAVERDNILPSQPITFSPTLPPISPLDATLMKNPGGGDVAVNWKPLCSEAACRRLFEGLFTR